MRKIIVSILATAATFNCLAENCTLSREQVSGESRFCYYACLRGERVLTVSNLQRCPLLSEFNSSSVFKDQQVTTSSVLNTLGREPLRYKTLRHASPTVLPTTLTISKDE